MRTCLCCEGKFKRTSVTRKCDRCALGWCDCPKPEIIVSNPVMNAKLEQQANKWEGKQ